MTVLNGSISYDNNYFAELMAELGDKGIVVFFTYIEDETSTVEAAITDNYAETNHSIQDHIAIKPKIYRLRGCIGEVVYKNDSKWLKKISDSVASKLSAHPLLQKTLSSMKPIGIISPVVGNYTQAAINAVTQIEASYNRYRKLIEDNFIKSKRPQLLGEQQETLVAYLNRLLELRIPVNLKGLRFKTVLNEDEPGKVIDRKYYLQSVSAHQGNNGFISDIEITIKEFRIATTKVTKMDKDKYGAHSIDNIMSAEEDFTGSAKGQGVPADTDKIAETATDDNIISKVTNKIKELWENAKQNYRTLDSL